MTLSTWRRFSNACKRWNKPSIAGRNSKSCWKSWRWDSFWKRERRKTSLPFLKGGKGGISAIAEENVLFQLGARKLLSRFSELPESLRALFEQYEFDIQGTFEQLSAGEDDERQRALEAFSGREIALTRIKELARAFPAENLEGCYAAVP